MSKNKQYSSEDMESGNQYLTANVSQSLLGKDGFNELKLAEQFSNQVFLAKNINELVNLGQESFLKIFSQPHCLIYEYNKTSQVLHLLNKTDLNQVSQEISFDDTLITTKESFLLNTSATINEALPINMGNAIIGSLFKASGEFNGFIICGQPKGDNTEKYINEALLPLFSMMTNIVGLCFNNLENNERIEEERKILNAQLKRSNEDLEQFAYIISHDLKAPLRNIKSFAQLLQKMYRSQLDGDGVTFLDFITGGVSKFDNLINDLLQYSRVSRREMPFEKVDLNEIIQEVILSTFITASKEDVEIKTHKLPVIVGNAHRLEQLIQCLVDNSVKFKQPNVKAKIAIKIQKEKESIQLSVIDNGIGIEKQYGERIFQLFQKLHADSEYKGTGLGLSICKKIVERHKGRIWMESNGLNKGTTFQIVLPRNVSNI